MGLQPSASKTALLLACQRPFAEDVATDTTFATEPMRYGSAFHEVEALLLLKVLKKAEGALYTKAVEDAAKKYDVAPHTRELVEHVRAYHAFLSAWLLRHGWTRVVEVETSYAMNPARLEVRKIAEPSAEEHKYADLRVGEVAGTVNLIAEDAEGKRALVLDHKTGFVDAGFSEPARIPQMKTLGLDREPRGVRSHRTRHRARRPARAPERALRRVRPARRRSAPKGSRRRAGSYRRWESPAERVLSEVSGRADMSCEGSGLLSGANAALATLTTSQGIEPGGHADLPEGIRDGRLYALIRQFRKLDEAATAEIKRKIKAGVLIELPTGETLGIQTQEYETLSKSTIIRALGKLEGERLIVSLRKRGVVEKAKREMILPEKAR